MNLESGVVTTFGSERLALLPERAAYHLETETLYIADLHIGRSATFRAAAIPIPDGDTPADLARLGRALARTGARRLIVLGDFLHAAPGQTDPHWAAWRSDYPDVDVTVVRGNHDEDAGDPPTEWGVDMVDEPFAVSGLTLKHHPEPAPGDWVLAGHEHPCIRLRGHHRDTVLLPCFHDRGDVLVLPAFTFFAGGHPVSARGSDRVFAIAEDAVLEVTQMVRAS